jgi:hypothetical protein
MTSIADILGREIKDRFALALASTWGASRLIGNDEKACRRGALPGPTAMQYVDAQRGGTFLRLALWS